MSGRPDALVWYSDTLTFDPDSAADRERISRVYRHAHVVLHETRDAEISMVADVPRRLLNRLG